MATVGVLSLPGVMTGQIPANSPPFEAAKYPNLMMLLISAGTGFDTSAAVCIGFKRLFDELERRHLDRLKS